MQMKMMRMKRTGLLCVGFEPIDDFYDLEMM